MRTPALLTAVLASLAIGTALTAPGLAQTAAEIEAKAATDPAAFAQVAGSANLFEIESSKLALEKAGNEEVRGFAQKIIDDHTAAGERMKAAADAAGVAVPTEMGEADRKALEALQAADSFDRAYVKAQVEAHDKAVSLFDAFAAQSAAGPLHDFAAETLPTLKDHEALAKALAGE